MTRPSIRLAALALSSLTILAAATTSRGAPAPTAVAEAAVLGPPWISIEHPVNPFDRTTRGAYLLVHAFHHGIPAGFPVRGTAEGIVGAQRKHVALQFERTSRPGVYALRRQWDTTGVWTLLIAVEQGPDDLAQAIVELAPDGRIASVAVPTTRRGDWDVPRRVTAEEVDRALQARASRLAASR